MLTPTPPSPLVSTAIRLCARAYDVRRIYSEKAPLPSYWDRDSLFDVDCYWVDGGEGDFTTEGMVWIVIPGTDSFVDWSTNLWFYPTKLQGIPGYWRSGFRLGAEWLGRFVRDRLQLLQGRRIGIVGHSLGGAIATILAATAVRDGWRDQIDYLLTIANPRTTTRNGVDYLAQHYPLSVGQRLAYGADIVPRSVAPLGWKHALCPLYINSKTLAVSNKPHYLRELTRAVFTKGWQVTEFHRMKRYLQWLADVRQKEARLYHELAQ